MPKRRLTPARIVKVLHRVPVFFNPFTDYGFKKLFGEDANKDLLIDFLNSILPEKHRVADLTFRNSQVLPAIAGERNAFFDIYCHTADGQEFVVEMQRLRTMFFKDRTVFYGSIPIRRQAPRSKDWNFELKPVYLIAILDFEFDEKDELALQAKVMRHVQLKDEDGKLFYDKLSLMYVHLPTFKKQEHELENRFEKWLFFLKNLESFQELPRILREPVFKKAAETAKISNMTQQQLERYERSWFNYLSNKAAFDTALQSGMEKGMEKGIQKGMEKGLEIGRAEGDKARQLAFVKKCHALGHSAEMTSELSEMPLKTVRALFRQFDEESKNPALPSAEGERKKRGRKV